MTKAKNGIAAVAATVVVVIMMVLTPSVRTEAADGWCLTAQGWVYGSYCNTWALIDGEWYYFDDNGIMTDTGYVDGYWLNTDGSWNEAYSNGRWFQNEIGWWYEDNGWYPVNETVKINGVYYYFDINGYLGGYMNYKNSYISKKFIDDPRNVDVTFEDSYEQDWEPECSYPNEELFNTSNQEVLPEAAVNNTVAEESAETATEIGTAISKIALTEDAAEKYLTSNGTGVGQLDTGLTITYLFYNDEDGTYCYYDAAQGGVIIIDGNKLNLESGEEVVYQNEHLILKLANNIPTVTKTEEDEGLVD